MQDLSIIRHATVPFIVHFGSNRCKIKNMKTMDGTNYNSESFKILEDIYKQEVIPESLYKFNKSIAGYDDFELSDSYHDILKKYEIYSEQDVLYKHLYYETYIEPALNKLESYIVGKYGADKNLRQILNEIKLEFTDESDYLLQYYTYKDFIRKEQEDGAKTVTKNDDISSKKTRIIISTPDNTESAELELNINRDVTIMVYLDTRSGQDKTTLLLALANFVKSGKLENIINSNQNAKIVKIYIQNEYEVTYGLYASDSVLLDKNTVSVSSDTPPLMGTTISILRNTSNFVLSISTIALSGILFAIVLFAGLSTKFAKELAAKAYIKFSKFNAFLKDKRQELDQKAQTDIQERNFEEQSKKAEELQEKYNKGEISKQDYVKMAQDIELKAYESKPKESSIIAVYALFALVITLILFQILGMPLLAQIAMILVYLILTKYFIQDNLWDTAKYVIANFGETFNMVVKSTSKEALILKGTMVVIFIGAIYYAIKIKNQKPPASFPSPDRLLTEIQTRFT
jgi:hypothetical protein